MANLRFKAFQNLIKQYCIDHVDVQHTVDGQISFVRMESRDDVNGIAQNGGKKVIVTMEDFSGRTIGAADDRQYVQSATMFFLGYADSNTGDLPGSIENAQHLAEEVMLQFEARMWAEYQADDCGPMKDMLWELTSYEPLDGPMLEHHYGWAMTINFKARKPVYDQTKWNNI